MKAISTVLAIVLLTIIVVALVGLSYTLFISLFTKTTGAAQTMANQTVTGLISQVRIESMAINDVVVRNVGSRDISEFTVLINGEQSNYTLDPPLIEPDKLGTIKIMDFIREDDEIGIIPGEGIVVTIKSPDPCDHAVLCLKFDEGQGTTAYDSSGYGNDGTLGDGTCIPGVGSCPDWVPGKYGNALSLDGIDDYVEVQNSLSLNSTEEITVIAWIKAPPQQTNDWPRIACKISWLTSGWCFLVKNDTNVLRWEIFTPNHRVVNGTTDILDNQWHHVVGTYDKKNLTIYVDGEFEANLTENAYMINNNLNLTIGRSEIRWFTGTIDEVRVYNKVIY